jgi:hypothetical protein
MGTRFIRFIWVMVVLLGLLLTTEYMSSVYAGGYNEVYVKQVIKLIGQNYIDASNASDTIFYVNPIIWGRMDVKTKTGLATMIAHYYVFIGGKSFNVVLYDSMTDKKLAQVVGDYVKLYQ